MMFLVTEWVDSPMIFTSDRVMANHPMSDQKLIIHGNPYIILFLTCFSCTKTEKSMKSPINGSPHDIIDGGQLVVVSCRHANTNCDVILTDCPQNVSKWVTCVFTPSSSWFSLTLCWACDYLTVNTIMFSINYYTLRSTKLKGRILVSPCPSIRLSIRPSVDRIVSAPYLLQYSLDPFHIYILSNNIRRCVVCKFFLKVWSFGKFFKFVT